MENTMHLSSFENDENHDETRCDHLDSSHVRENDEKEVANKEDRSESSTADSSIDSNIEIVNQDEINSASEDKENVNNASSNKSFTKSSDRIRNKINSTCGELSYNNLSLDRSVDRSKTSIDDLSFSQRTLIKSCSLRSLVTELVNDELLFDKAELSKHLDELEKEKFFQIIKIIKQEDSDKKIEQLKELCITDKGLILSDLRRIVWPIITNAQHIEVSHLPDHEAITKHAMYNQVIQDVNRTIKRFPPSIDKDERLSKEKQLTDLIMRILIENPNFDYYQGYHDICITFLLLLGEEKAFHVVNKVSNSHLSQFMEKNMDSTQLMLEIIPILIEREDEELALFLDRVEVGTIFSLSWVLTWFSHILVNNRNVERLFDIFIATDHRLPIYFTACILLYNRDHILTSDADMAQVFQCLSALLDKEDMFPFEPLLVKAQDLLALYPPDTLLEEQKIRIDNQRAKEERLRSAYKSRKQKSNNNLLDFVENNKTLIAATLVIAIGAITFQFFKTSET